MKKEEILKIVEENYAIDFTVEENVILAKNKLGELALLVSTGNIAYLIEFAILNAAIQNIDL